MEAIMSSPLLQRGPLQQPPPPSPSGSHSLQEEVEEHHQQLMQRSFEGVPLPEPFSFTGSTESTVADIKHGSSGDGRHDGKWRLEYGDDNTKSSPALFGCHDYDGAHNEDADDMSMVCEQGEADCSLGSAPHQAEMRTAHWPLCKRGETEEGQEKAWGVISARQRTSSAPRRGAGIGSYSCASSNAEAIADCSSSGGSPIPNSDGGRAALDRRELIRAEGHPVVSEEEDKGDRYCGTPHSSSHGHNADCNGTAASQRFEHAAQQDLLLRTSRKLVYSNSATMLSPTVVDTAVEGSDTAVTPVAAPTKSDGVHDDQDGVTAVPTVKRLEGAAVSHGKLSPLYLAASDVNGASPSAHWACSALPCHNALQAPSAVEAPTLPSSSSAAHAKVVPLCGSMEQGSGETANLQDTHRRLPPSASAPSEVDRVDAEIENAMLEMEKRLQRHCHHAGAATTGADSDGCVASHSSTPSLRRSEGDISKRAESDRMENQRAHPSSFSATHEAAADAASVKSAHEEDWLARRRCKQAGVCDAEGVGAYRRGRALGEGAPAWASAAYTFFSSQLRPPEDRRGRIYELAKALREDGAHAALRGPGGGLLASPPADEQSPGRVEGAAPLRVPCAARGTSVSLGDAVAGSADMAMFRSQSTPVPPVQGERFAPHQQEFTAAGLQVYYSRCSLSSGEKEPRRCPRLSGSTLLGSSVVEGMPSAATAEGVSTAMAAAAALTVDSSGTSSCTPFTSRRQRPPPRMLCPPTPSPSPSPSRSTAMDAVLAAVANAEEGKESDAGVMEQSVFAEAAPGAEPQLQPQSRNANVLPGQSSLEPCTVSLGVEAADTMPLEAATAAANPATLSPWQTLLWSSSSAPTVPADTVVPAAASAVATTSAADVDSDAGVSVIRSSSSCLKRAVEGNDGADTGLQGELANREGALTEPRPEADTSVSVGDADGPLPLSPRCASSEPSKLQLHGGHTFASSAYRADSAPQHAGVVAANSASSLGCERAASGAASHHSASPPSAAVTAAVPLMRHDGAGEDSLLLPICATSFPQGGQSTGRMSLPPSRRDGCGGAFSSWSTSSAACEGAGADNAVDVANDATDDGVQGHALTIRQSANTRKSPSTAVAEGEEHPQVPMRFLSSSAVSPSPIRPSTGGASGKERLHHELPILHWRAGGGGEVGGGQHDDADSSDEYNEAHLCCDDWASSPAEPAAAAATFQTRQSDTPDGLHVDSDDDDNADDDGGEDTAGQTWIEEALRRAEAKCAVLRLELTFATERAVAAEANARARERECAELHALASRMQAQLAAAQMTAEWATANTRADAEVQVAACTASLDDIAASAFSSPNSPNRLGTTSLSMRKGTALADGTVWRRRHDIVAQELATLKVSMAEQLAVLDRLGMQPPFSEELVCAAERRLRHVKVAHAPGTAMKASQPDATIPGTPHTLTRSTCVDSAASADLSAGGASVTATTKKIQVRNGNKIAALLNLRKQNRHQEKPAAAAADAMATGVTDSATTPSTSAPPVKRDGSEDCRTTLDAKENHYVV
ncbi:conserved hypothetical protein [Leishmania major strain Friedlin]|uniref:Uncharacterized protein n=1 Tax=Leishmania major TaxID=5664 RepID=Q4Q1K9_LEIMA|nr:conserved hypothetical protein [Leishmania major strain Friedlin]CAG9583741.1 hypothetical_protein_-_conserved [Leishmania major strain Friedlin]CAJ09170.1 conserved hypothetical protein [Leishmania major strain Friedlin]|eukprot:XP_001686789.1 conserved hypothetical protein [Leishmania major strain Friedlin]